MKNRHSDKGTSWIDVVLNYPRLIIGICLLITLLMGWNIPRIVIDSDIKSMLPKDQEIIVTTNKLEEIFGGSEIVILSIKSDDIFSKSTLTKLQKLTDEVESLPIVERVLSLTNAFELHSIADGFEVRDLIEQLPETEEERAALRQRIMNDEMLYGNIVSKDFQYTAVIAILPVTKRASDDQITYDTFNALKVKYSGPEKIYIAGLPLTRKAITMTMQSDMKALFPFGIALMIFLLVFAFRSWVGAFLPFIVVIMSVVNTLGLMALLQIKFTFISVMLPVMLIAIANDYSIHIIAYYYVECGSLQGLAKDEIVHRTIQHLKTPVFLAGITTIMGFLSLQTHILTPARQMGLLSSFGITVALLLSVTFVPAVLKLLDVPMVLQRGDNNLRVNRWLANWGQFFITNRKVFLIGSLLFVIVVVTGIPRIIVDTNPMHYYRKNAEIRVSNDNIDKNFGGSTQLSVLVEGDIKDPLILRKMDELTTYLEQEPTITRTISIVDYIKKMNQAFNSDSTQYYAIPVTRDAVAQYLLLFSISGDESNLSQVVNYDYTQAQIMARVNETSSVSLHKLLVDTRNYIKSQGEEAIFPTVTGFVAVVGELVNMVVQGQMRSLIMSLILVSLVCMIIFRSVVAGLLSIVPLSAAILIVFGLMGYAGIELNVATAMLSSIMIGVGVDYTIHFLYRFRFEVQQGLNAKEAVIRTLTTSGKGIIYNALSVIIGFTVLLLSGFLPIYFFGFLIVFSISACLIGALTIMPALMVIIRPKFIFDKRR